MVCQIINIVVIVGLATIFSSRTVAVIHSETFSTQHSFHVMEFRDYFPGFQGCALTLVTALCLLEYFVGLSGPCIVVHVFRSHRSGHTIREDVWRFNI